MTQRRTYLLLALAAAAITAAIVGYNVWLDRDIKSKMYVPKPATITPEVVLLRTYVTIDTTNPPGNELAGARYLASVLAREGVKAEVIESAPGRGNVYARIKGRTSGQGLLLLHHIDVVPANAKEWTQPPFGGKVQFEMLYGRGTLDMKGIGICHLAAFLDVARSHHTPERDIIFLGVADEESGGSMGMAWLLAHRPELFDGVRYALNEGGITETLEQKLTYFGVEIGSKMTMTVRVRAGTREALEQARIALEPWIVPQQPERVLPEVKEFFHDLAPVRTEQRAWLDDVDKTVAEGKFWLLSRPYRELTQNVVWPQAVRQDGSGFTMDVLMFNLPDELPPNRVAWLTKLVAPFGVTIDEVTRTAGPAPISSRHTPLFALITREVHAVHGDIRVGAEILAAAFNDSRFLRARGIDCYGMWPFAVDFFQTQGIHSVDERIRIDWFQSGVELTKRIVRAYAFEPLPAG